MQANENIIRTIAGKVVRKLLPEKEYVEIDGSIIPSPGNRFCSAVYQDDGFYVKSSEHEANRIVDHFGANKGSRVLDIGCGQGRLPIGILRVIGEIDYTGIDIDRRSVDWCKRYIEAEHPTFKFRHLDLHNERYNKTGTRIDEDFRFDIEPGSIDIVFLFSVFSHTTEEDMRVYLKEIARILVDGGNVFFTTFVEEDVPNFSENPDNYQLECSGPLHVVRYNKEYLFSILDEYGYSVSDFTHQTEPSGQSAIYLSKKS